MFSEVIKSFQ